MKRGLVVGKFYPFHRGHAYLIEAAIRGSDEVTVMVCDRSDQVPSAGERAGWISQSFPSVSVLVVPDIGNDNDSALWARYTRHVLGFSPDIVFTSEPYGDAYAGFLGAEHVSVDRLRETVPISGTKIRNGLSHYWEYLMPGVKARFAKRVAIIGPESTGKTVLSKKLAEYFHTVWVPEYGRLLSEGKQLSGAPWETSEFERIAEAQNRMEDTLARSANRVLICDTNAWATSIWHERYMGYASNLVARHSEGRKYDLILLTAPDVPFMQDGLRDGERVRTAMFRRFRETLEKERLSYHVISGENYDHRFDESLRAVEAVVQDSLFVFPEFPSAIDRIDCGAI